MSLSPREQIASATMVANHEVVTNLTRAKTAMETLVHEMHDLTCLLTRDGRIIWGNTTTAQWLAVEHDSLHEIDLRPLFVESEWNVFQRRLGAMSGESKDEEFNQALLVKGQVREVLWSLRPFKAVSDRRGLLILAVGRDITDVLNARTERAKLEAELETAQIMQQAFFPPAHIKTKNLEVCSYYRPAEHCSGDWWGYFDLGHDVELLCIADVTGHGAASALVTAMTQASCMSYAKRHFESQTPVSASKLLQEINDVVYHTFKGDFYMTFFAFILEHKKQILRVSNAGHNFPMALRANRSPGKYPETIVIQGNPIGHADATFFAEQDLPLAKGDRYVLFTDGFTECRNPAHKMYGSGNFRRSVLRNAEKSAIDFRDGLVADALGFFDGQALADDLTLLTLDILG
ncbi:MAG: SpoIIE family protein phosphatase [Oligoflexus sp.]|nr:SpoIIE family protein phosphatase [Oligoflexus sp.]